MGDLRNSNDKQYTQDDVEAACRKVREDTVARCCSIADGLATRWERSAAKTREEGSYTTRAVWPPFKLVKLVAPKWDRAAKDMEAGAHGLRTVSALCRGGFDPRGTDEVIVETPKDFIK